MSAMERLHQQLEEIIVLLQRANTTERIGAVSSVQIEDSAKGPPRVTTKRYSGSEPEVEEAIEDHARAKQLANEAYLADWQMTIDQLKFQARAGDRSS